MTTTIQIEKTTLQGDLELFALPVAAGAEVMFIDRDAGTGPGFRVDFPNSSPFDGDECSFPVPRGGEVSKRISPDAVAGIYSFHVAEEGKQDPVAYYQIAVTTGDGLNKLGFSVHRSPEDTVMVDTRLYVSSGSEGIVFEKLVVNQTATVVVRDGRLKENRLTIPVGETSLTMPLRLEEPLTVVLESGGGLDGESGGTKTVDIIPEG